MESFYGGRQGASFIIKKSFKYLNEEDPAYKKALEENGGDSDVLKSEVMEINLTDPNYKDVWYNEYCLIDTVNKNNPNNGKIFRRRFPDQTVDGLPYEYLGTIVGPSSGAPMLRPQSGLLNFDTIRSEFPEGHWDGLGLSEDKDGKTILKIYDPSFSDGDLSTWPSSVTLKENSIKMEEGLVKGASNFESKYDSNVGAIVHKPGTIVDEIKYNWFNVRKNTENDEGVVESWCYIGFEIPATVFSVSAKYKTPGTRPMAYEVERNDNPEDSIGHPFWYDWRFEIPGGLRGVSIEKIFINDTDVKDNNNNNLYEVSAYVFDDLWYNTATDTYAFIEDATPKIYKDRSWFCEARILNPSATTDSPELLKQTDESDTVTFFLGEITEIDNVTLDTETGHLEFIYHNQKTDSYDLRYPIDVRMEEETGHVEVDYSLLEEDGVTHTKEEWDFRYPIDINIEPLSGEFTTTYSLIDRKENGEPVLDENGQYIHKTETEYLRYPIDIQMIEETGEVVTTYSCAKGENMPAETTHNFRYPIDVHMDTKTGEVTTIYSLIDRTEDGDPVLDENGKYIHETETEYFRYPIDVHWDVDKGDLAVDYSYADPKNEEEKSTHEWEFTYPKTIAWEQKTDKLIDDTGKEEDITYFTGQFDIDYTHYDNLIQEQKKACPNSGKIGYMRKVVLSEGEDEKSGTMTFVNTIDEHSQTYDFSYPKQIVFNMDQDKKYYDGSWDIYYYGAEDQHGQFVFPKTLNISKDGVFSYVDSAGDTTTQQNKIVFVDDVFVDNAHQLWIAYTDNAQMESQGIETGTPLDKNGVPLENGKTYINYGQTLGKLGVESSLITGPDKETILAQFESTYPLGVKDGEVTGQLFVVTTSDSKNPISYFVMWNPDARKWEIVSEIAGSPIGVPAQIGSDSDSWTYQDSLLLADGHVRFVTEQVVALSEDELAAENPVYWK